MDRITEQLSRVTSQYYGSTFFGLLMANAAMWNQALNEAADEMDRRICEFMLKECDFKVEVT